MQIFTKQLLFLKNCLCVWLMIKWSMNRKWNRPPWILKFYELFFFQFRFWSFQFVCCILKRIRGKYLMRVIASFMHLKWIKNCLQSSSELKIKIRQLYLVRITTSFILIKHFPVNSIVKLSYPDFELNVSGKCIIITSFLMVCRTIFYVRIYVYFTKL